jgi:hypothetical protein
LISTPRAPFRLISSSSGLAMAFSAACQRAGLALGLAGAHHGLAHLVHHRADIGEVEVDEARTHHQVGHALDALVEHVVGHREGLGEGRLLVGEPEQVLVGNDDQRIDDLLQRLDPLVGLAHALGAFELEGFRDDADGQDAKLARGLRDDRRGPVPVPPPMPGGDEGHVRAGEVIDDLLDRFLGGTCAHGGPRACAKPLGHARAHLDAAGRLGLRERLRIGVRNHELAALKALGNHVVYGIAACPAHAEHGDARFEVLPWGGHGEIECHRSVRLLSGLSGSIENRPRSCAGTVWSASVMAETLMISDTPVTRKIRVIPEIWGENPPTELQVAV